MEAVDRRNPSLIRVATVAETEEYRMLVSNNPWGRGDTRHICRGGGGCRGSKHPPPPIWLCLLFFVCFLLTCQRVRSCMLISLPCVWWILNPTFFVKTEEYRMLVSNNPGVIRQLLLRWYLRQQRVRVRVMIGFLVRVGEGLIRVRVGVTFNGMIYHWSNCRSKCRTFNPGGGEIPHVYAGGGGGVQTPLLGSFFSPFAHFLVRKVGHVRCYPYPCMVIFFF